MSNYDTDYLVTQVKRRASMPSSQALFTPTKLVLMLDDELKTRIVPFMMAIREEWYVTTLDYTGDGTTTVYPIPSDAVGSKLRDVAIWGTGNNGNLQMENNVPRLDPDSLYDANFGFYVQNNNIVFYPHAVDNNKTIRFTYFKRVDDLVETTAAAQISVIASNTVDTSATPPSTFVTGASVQIISSSSPFKPVFESTISTVVGSTITFADTVTDAVVGDWVCLAGQSVFPQTPIELIPCLCEAVVVKCLEALGDTDGMQSAMANYQQMELSARSTLSPRVDGAVKKIMHRKRLIRYIW